MSDETLEQEPRQQSATAVSRKLAPGGGGGGAWIGGPKTASSDKFGNVERKRFNPLGENLFGEDMRPDTSSVLRQRFDFAPFTVLNARDGDWQARKRAWLALGIQSEVGRGENLLKMSDTLLEPDPEKRAAMQAARGDAKTFGSGGPGDLSAGFKARAYNDKEWQEKVLGHAQTPTESTGTSIFDPVLCELSYKWFCPPGGLILDPFAGGSVRGIIAGILGYRYYGIELRQEQVLANEEQRRRIAPDADISWVCGDSYKLLDTAPDADFVFSCPPYGDLEQYSDDPADLSAMTWEQFAGTYRGIIRKAVGRLKENRFACFVIGEYRDKQTGLYRGFVPLTAASFMAAGAPLYNEAILITSVGSLAIRVTKQFETSRKLGKTHQNVLVHVKGDPKVAAGLCTGNIGLPLPLPRPEAAPAPALAPSLPAPIMPDLPARAAPEPAPGPLDTPFPVQAGAPAPTPNALEFAATAQVEVSAPRGASLAEFLNAAPIQKSSWKPQEPPDLTGIPNIVLNFETNGLNWAKGDRPIGLTVGTMDGKLRRYLPFAHQGGDNLDEEAVRRYAREQIRGKHITNINTRFDVHMAREWGIDLEEQGNTVSDVAHYAALLDDHRRKFALDVLAQDWLGGVDIMRVDERNMSAYAAASVAERAEYQALLVAQLREKMWPELDAQDLQRVRQLEDDVIYPVCEMEKNGAQLDIELLDAMFRECTSHHERLMQEVTREAGFPFELTSAGWSRLFEKCGIPPQDSYAEDVREIYLGEHPLLEKAHLASQYASLNSKTFAAYKKNIDSNGLLRFDINQLRGDDGGTVSGRFSIGYVQQVPNHDNHHNTFGIGEIEECEHALCNLFPRRVFVPYEGSFLAADAAQIEYRIFAHFAGNKKVLDAYAKDPWMSFHKYMWPQLKEYKPDMLYSWTKNYNFMVMYGGGLAKKALMIGSITKREYAAIMAEENNPQKWNNPKLAEAKKIQEVYDTVMPEVSPLIARASHLAKSKCDDDCRRGLSGRHRSVFEKLHKEFPHRGFVRTIEGRRSRFPNNWKTFRGINRVIQGSAADVNKRKIVELHRARKHTGLLMRLTVHDEIGGDARLPETKERVGEVLNAQSYPQLSVPIMWEVRTGRNWAECK